MNVLENIADDFEFFKEPKRKTIVPLFPDWEDYEREKRAMQKESFSPELYQQKIRESAEYLNL